MTFTKQWVDPAEGWKYGFPRIYIPAQDGPLREWLVKGGYPKEMLSLPIRFWEAKEVSDDEN